jgi:hypothetical protein
MPEKESLILTFADDDINENWELYKENFVKGEFP